jgi:hypothetical protein
MPRVSVLGRMGCVKSGHGVAVREDGLVEGVGDEPVREREEAPAERRDDDIEERRAGRW